MEKRIYSYKQLREALEEISQTDFKEVNGNSVENILLDSKKLLTKDSRDHFFIDLDLNKKTYGTCTRTMPSIARKMKLQTA